MVSDTNRPTPSGDFWRGRRVLITGHTGFKGSWLALWLEMLGSQVHGLALEPPTQPSLFKMARVSDTLHSDHRTDVRDAAGVASVVLSAAPSIIFHLAAQPLVRDGYRRPTETFATNVMGTVNVLEAARNTPSVEAIVVITTDKVYRPPHLQARPGVEAQTEPHREDEELGAEDPYGWSKVAAEHAVAAFRGLPAIDDTPAWTIPVATARAGNVLGGGDWSSERLVPDCIRSFGAGKPVELRFPDAVRPWQHILDPLNGYLLLAEALIGPNAADLPDSLNFGPRTSSELTVGEVARCLASLWGSGAEVRDLRQSGDPHENPMLRLDGALAQRTLGWAPLWGLDDTLTQTVDWYRAVASGADAREVTATQIGDFLAAGRA